MGQEESVILEIENIFDRRRKEGKERGRKEEIRVEIGWEFLGKPYVIQRVAGGCVRFLFFTYRHPLKRKRKEE